MNRPASPDSGTDSVSLAPNSVFSPQSQNASIQTSVPPRPHLESEAEESLSSLGQLQATPTSPSAQRTPLERRHSSPVLMSYQRTPEEAIVVVSNWISVISTIGGDKRFCIADIGKAVSQFSKNLDCDQPDKAALKASFAALFTLLEKQMEQGEMKANLSLRFQLSQLRGAIDCMPAEIARELRFSICGVTLAFVNLTKDK